MKQHLAGNMSGGAALQLNLVRNFLTLGKTPSFTDGKYETLENLLLLLVATGFLFVSNR